MKPSVWVLLLCCACGKSEESDQDSPTNSEMVSSTDDGENPTGDDDGSPADDDGTEPEDPGDGHRVRCFEWTVTVPAEGGSAAIPRAACVADIGNAMKKGARPDCAVQDAADFSSTSGSGWTSIDVWPSERTMSDALTPTDCAAGESLPGGVDCFTWDDSVSGAKAACMTIAEGSVVVGARPECAVQDMLGFNTELGGNWTEVETWPSGREMYDSPNSNTDCAGGSALPEDVDCFTWEDSIPMNGSDPMVVQRAACLVHHNDAVLSGARPECAVQEAVEYHMGSSSAWSEVDVWPSGREMYDASGASDCAGGQSLND